MAGQSVAPVEVALAKIGVTLLDEHKAQLEQIAERIGQQDVKAIMDALAAHLTMHGVAGALEQPLRNAITGSEPQVALTLSQNVNEGLDALEAWLRKVASEAPRS